MSRLLTSFSLVAAFALMFALTACAEVGTSDAEVPAGAREVAEPALQLVTVSAEGSVTRTGLPDGISEEIAEIAPADTVTTDGRYIFAARVGSVTIVDGGAWSWNHGDHFHYYTGPARVVGEVVGRGIPTVATGERSIGIRFSEGEIVLVRVASLGDGEIEELLRTSVEPGDGMAVPLAYGAWVSENDGAGVIGLREVREDGETGGLTPCAHASGAITTVVGVVVGCADGAVIAVDGRPTRSEHVAREVDAADVAAFTGRAGRPTVSALMDPRTVWLLDTRERTWTQWTADVDLAAVVAVDDSAGHVVAVSSAGQIIVLAAATGDVLSRTEAGVAVGATPTATQRTTYLVGDTRVIAFDHATGETVGTFEVPAGGTTVLTGI